MLLCFVFCFLVINYESNLFCENLAVTTFSEGQLLAETEDFYSAILKFRPQISKELKCITRCNALVKSHKNKVIEIEKTASKYSKSKTHMNSVKIRKESLIKRINKTIVELESAEMQFELNDRKWKQTFASLKKLKKDRTKARSYVPRPGDLYGEAIREKNIAKISAKIDKTEKYLMECWNKRSHFKKNMNTMEYTLKNLVDKRLNKIKTKTSKKRRRVSIKSKSKLPQGVNISTKNNRKIKPTIVYGSDNTPITEKIKKREAQWNITKSRSQKKADNIYKEKSGLFDSSKTNSYKSNYSSTPKSRSNTYKYNNSSSHQSNTSNSTPVYQNSNISTQGSHTMQQLNTINTSGW